MRTMQTSQPRSQWSSPASYIIVTTGAVVGLGNIMQFPYLISHYGGLFILCYIIFELIIAIPLLFAELIIGRRGKQNPVGSLEILTLECNRDRRWRYIGWLCFIVSFLTLAYYAVQASFPLSYFFGSLNIISLYGTDEATPISLNTNVLTNFLPIFISFTMFLIATMLVIMRGINRGLEKISWIIVPTYFVILTILAFYMCFQGNFIQSLKNLFTAHPEQSLLTIVTAAMSYAFFKLNVGMGSMIVYGSYLPYTASFRRSTLIIVLLDLFISLVAYFVIYPAMLLSHNFIYNLTNHNIIHVFMNIPNGFLVAALFFLSAVFAAWMCAIAMAETASVILIERFNISRFRAACFILVGALIIGSFAALTHTNLMHAMIYHALPLQGIVKTITGNILIPISALLIAIFAGWILKRNITASELRFSPMLYNVWSFFVKYIAPISILFLIIANLGTIVLMLQ